MPESQWLSALEVAQVMIEELVEVVEELDF